MGLGWIAQAAVAWGRNILLASSVAFVLLKQAVTNEEAWQGIRLPSGAQLVAKPDLQHGIRRCDQFSGGLDPPRRTQ